MLLLPQGEFISITLEEVENECFDFLSRVAHVIGDPCAGGTGGMAVAAPPAAARIKLDISAREELKGAIRQHLTMELQAQQPVQFVESDPDWTLGVVTTELTDANGATVAVGLSFIVERHGIHAKMLKALAQACRYFLATGLLKDAPLERDMQLLLRGAEVLPEPEGLAVVSQHKMCVITPGPAAAGVP